MAFYTRFVQRLDRCSAIDNDGQAAYLDLRHRHFPDDLPSSEAEKEGGVVGEHFRGHARLWMHLIQTPLLMIHSKDDPVVAYSNQDWETATENEHIIGVTTKRGGHVAFFHGLMPFGGTWSDTVAMRQTSSRTTAKVL